MLKVPPSSWSWAVLGVDLKKYCFAGASPLARASKHRAASSWVKTLSVSGIFLDTGSLLADDVVDALLDVLLDFLGELVTPEDQEVFELLALARCKRLSQIFSELGFLCPLQLRVFSGRSPGREQRLSADAQQPEDRDQEDDVSCDHGSLVGWHRHLENLVRVPRQHDAASLVGSIVVYV